MPGVDTAKGRWRHRDPSASVELRATGLNQRNEIGQAKKNNDDVANNQSVSIAT